ncbi:hypothetical protein CEK26_003316 [Fusarium fujikuroi]|uniref:Uncharacterized protein n=1 Tax=Fusarium fujikuroi TaxID=5127 RepID=A0A5Q3GEP2_FUSFU|nr:hypothetical protein CEK27_003311 [Fusarium fujikuroi]QGI88316.1 hypothetical protein CEK25_003272 [Fusarium fujikuroi]QGJ01872.1 hypothetical protein CEK26_003316 [Fusarium fujikuroi]VTT68481.1 unnamed protein product [Fusarium fujikuroi]VTT80100.1 unnamed protein product [Fusarium fujikuroi]
MSRFCEDMSDLSLPATTYTTMLQQDPRLKEACRSKIAETREEYRNWRLQQAEIPPQAPPYITSQTAPQRTQEQIQAESEYVQCSRQWKEALDILSTAEIQMRAAEARMAALGVVPDAHALLHQMSSTNHG